MRDNVYPAQNTTYVVFTSLGDGKRSERLLRQEVNTVIPAKTEYMHWSERPVTCTWEDHPSVMPNLGGYALVLNPTIVAPRPLAGGGGGGRGGCPTPGAGAAGGGMSRLMRRLVMAHCQSVCVRPLWCL